MFFLISYKCLIYNDLLFDRGQSAQLRLMLVPADFTSQSLGPAILKESQSFAMLVPITFMF